MTCNFKSRAAEVSIRIAFTVQYVGTDFFGFQLQKSERTVQAELEKALALVLRERVRIYCSGRTDTGVHALAQVVHLETTNHDIELHRLIYSLNAVMPNDVSIIHGQFVEADFHARFSCLGREYIYKIVNAPYRMADEFGSSYWVRQKLDIEAMRKAVEPLIGEFDFAAFTPSIHVRANEITIRRIDDIKILQIGTHVYFHFCGSGFLHNMIRILTGTLIEIGTGRAEPGKLKNALESKQRTEAGITIPPQGLYFAYAKYKTYQTPGELIPLREILLNRVY
ncbi:MAG: tRNA pseudouridine(38-40) synthase TruA [Leptospiraceae bacterium]|nr:tRNA pseudouridine(38-40) synthase TruA [Leptospiraceae bacterium]